MIRPVFLSFLLAAALPGQDVPTVDTPAPVVQVDPGAMPAQPAPAPKTVVRLDDGLLDPAWFAEDIQFTQGKEVDYYWIKPGLNLTGRTLYMKPWEDPAMLNPSRDGKDNAKATVLTDSLPATIRGALTGHLKGQVKVSRSEGDVEVTGRVVDCNAGNLAVKMLVGLGAGQERVTFDIKMLDAQTRELLVAIHHRTISGTALSNLEGKLVKWSDHFGDFMAQKTVAN
jgi:hypothetical protein